MIFREETWAEYAKDAAALWRQDYDELARDKRMPLDPDEAAYRQLERDGQLLVVTARDGGTLAGFQIAIVARHPHHSTLCGYQDALYLAPGHRKGMTGAKLIRATEARLRSRGAEVFLLSVPVARDSGPLLRRLGYEHDATIYAKRID